MRRDARPAQKADTLATRRRAKARDRVPQAWLTIPIVTARPCVEAGGADMLRPLPHSGKGGPGPQRCRLNFAAPGGFRFLSPRRKEHVTVPCSMEMCTSPCGVVQFPTGTLSRFATAPSRREPLCTLMLYCKTRFFDRMNRLQLHAVHFSSFRPRM